MKIFQSGIKSTMFCIIWQCMWHFAKHTQVLTAGVTIFHFFYIRVKLQKQKKTKATPQLQNDKFLKNPNCKVSYKFIYKWI